MSRVLGFMQKSWDSYEDRVVKLICFPLPPTPVNDVIYMPSSFTSDIFDKKFNRSEEFNVVSVRASKLGPAILAYVKLKSIVSFDDKTGFLTVPRSTCCATVSSYTLFRGENGLQYANECKLDNVSMMGRSCHPGSHYVVPKAPYLSALLQYAQAPTTDSKAEGLRIEYMNPDDGALIFQHANFDTNKIIDEYLSKCFVSPNVSYYKTRGGLGIWSREYLRQMRVNILLRREKNV